MFTSKQMDLSSFRIHVVEKCNTTRRENKADNSRRLKDIDWDVIVGKTDVVMTELEEGQKLARAWRARKA